MTRPSSLADLASIYDSQPISGMRNRIINGDMRIDQRNAGASVTPASDVYHLDRWVIFAAPYGGFTVQQNAGSVTPPPGFTNYFGITSTSTTAASTGNYAQIVQQIEGFNTGDLNWGTSTAQTVTLSFWVRSSLTGTFGGSLRNSADNRAYLFSYTINAANTWEQKIITIPGDTTGTWLTNNGRGISLRFAFMMGSTVVGAPGSWTTGGTFAPTGQTNVLGTNGATFYLTGVQLEAGPFATPFERRHYGQELMLCQRYFERWDGGAGDIIGTVGQAFSSTSGETTVVYVVEKRAAPVVTTVGSFNVWTGAGQINQSSIGFAEIRTRQLTWQYGGASGGTVGQAIQFFAFGAPAALLISAEL